MKNNDKHVGLESHFAAGDHGFLLRSTLIAFAADRIAFQQYSKHLSHCTGTYQLISIGAWYVKIDQYSIRNTLSISWLTRQENERNSEIKPTSVVRIEINSNHTCQASVEDKMRSSKASEKIVGYEDRPTKTYYVVRWYRYGYQNDTTELAGNIPPIIGMSRGESYGALRKNASVKEQKEWYSWNGTH